MGVIYKPFGLVIGVLAGFLSKQIFNAIWSRLDDEEAPKPTTHQANWPKILIAAALQGIVFKLTRAVVDRHAAKSFAFITGSWPGEERPGRAGLG